MSSNRAAIYVRQAPGADPDPNTTEPGPGLFFTAPDWYSPLAGALLLTIAKSTGGTATATVNVWIYDEAVNKWVLIVKAISLSEGNSAVAVTPTVGAYYKTHVQVTASAGIAGGQIVGYWMPR